MTSPSEAEPNQEQAKYWNETGGPRWVAMQGELDAELEPFGDAVMERLGLGAGDRVLDIGCGAGATSLRLAERVRPGSVLGVDISEPLLNAARERAKGVANLRFELGDAQSFALPRAGFDAVFSRFGVMFFAAPVAAFANLRGALRSGGRVGFICWRSIEQNPSFTLPLRAALPFLSEPPEPPKAGEPGPFAFAERERIESVLTSAGYRDVVVTRHDTELIFGGRRDLEGAVELAFQVGPLGRFRDRLDSAAKGRAWAAVRAAFEPYNGASGVVLPAATWLVGARTP